MTALWLLLNSVYVQRRKTIVLTVCPPPMSVFSISCFGVQRLARFSLNVGAHYSIYPSLDSTAAFSVVTVVTPPKVSFGFSEEIKKLNYI